MEDNLKPGGSPDGGPVLVTAGKAERAAAVERVERGGRARHAGLDQRQLRPRPGKCTHRHHAPGKCCSDTSSRVVRIVGGEGFRVRVKGRSSDKLTS